MEKKNYKVLSSRKITEAEYNLILKMLNKYQMSTDNFIKNSKTLLLNKIENTIDIYNGYDPINNVILYNDSTNIIRELLHVASSSGKKEQGICIKVNRVYKKSRGYALNEGITDLFLEYANGDSGFYNFEKVCAKVLMYAFGVDIYKNYFLNDDGNFRHLFNNNFPKLLSSMDDYMVSMIKLKKLISLNKELPIGIFEIIKIYMDIVIEDLLKVTETSNEEGLNYLKDLLNSEDMTPIYNIIGKYEYKE